MTSGDPPTKARPGGGPRGATEPALEMPWRWAAACGWHGGGGRARRQGWETHLPRLPGGPISSGLQPQTEIERGKFSLSTHVRGINKPIQTRYRAGSSSQPFFFFFFKEPQAVFRFPTRGRKAK